MHEIPNLDAKGLRHFALTTGALIAALFGVALPLLFGWPIPWWPFATAAALMLWGLAAPRSLAPVYRGWMGFGRVMNLLTTPLILGLLFIALFVPTGLIMRLLGHDPLQRRRPAATPTYRVPSRPATRESITRPF